jgi:flagellar hook protein FlgE
MTISSSLNAGVSGLTANASRLAAISDNIANSATFGYKRAATEFMALVAEGRPGNYVAGGVRASNHRLVADRGSLVTTGNATDLAVRGRGMIPVTDSVSGGMAGGQSRMLLTTTGSFRPDANGMLRTASGLYLLGWPAEPDGTIPAFPRDTRVGLQPVQISANQMSGDPTTLMNIVVNLPATETEAGSPGTARTLSIEYFDNLGKSQNVSVTFTPTVPGMGASNEWTMVLTDSASGGAVIGEYVLTFDDSRAAGGTLASVTTVTGGAYDPALGTMSVDVAGGPITINIGRLGDPGGMTQLSDVFSPVDIGKNGSPAGRLQSVEIDENGYVHAIYDVGISRRLYQIPLVDVPNPNGLTAHDSQTYSVSAQSGAFFLWNAGEGPTGDLVSYAREESATDVAAELTQLIVTQRAYSSNAKVITTVDEMLQETTNLKR